MILICNNEQETFSLGFKMGKEARSGQIYCLDGDLGTGKTVFTKGFAKGLGIDDHITSPTFTIVNEYMGRLPFYHFDVYRIENSDEMFEIGFDDYISSEGVCLIEWAEIIEELLPKESIRIRIKKDYSKNDNYRIIEVK